MNKNVTIHLKEHPLSITIVCLITILSLMKVPEIEMAEDMPLFDKWAHMVMYGTLSITVWAEHVRRHRRQASHAFLFVWSLIVPILIGGAMELAQAYLTTVRSGDWMDFLANSIGAGIAYLLGAILLKTAFRK
ncbi:MAG: VanZ family protein [Bacteroidaceae bacterium]